MKAFVCVDSQDWEEVVRGAARYLGGDDEVVLARVVDERTVLSRLRDVPQRSPGSPTSR